MNLKGKISAAHRVQKVEADGKFCPETSVDSISEKFSRVSENQIDRGNLDSFRAETEKKTILFRYTIKAPGVVRLTLWEIANFFHPVASPRSRVKIRNDSERSICGLAKSITQSVARN